MLLPEANLRQKLNFLFKKKTMLNLLYWLSVIDCIIKCDALLIKAFAPVWEGAFMDDHKEDQFWNNCMNLKMI